MKKLRWCGLFLLLVVVLWWGLMHGPIVGNLPQVSSEFANEAPFVVERYCLTSNWHAGQQRLTHSVYVKPEGERFLLPPGLRGSLGCYVWFHHPRLLSEKVSIESPWWNALDSIELTTTAIDSPRPVKMEVKNDEAQLRSHLQRLELQYFPALKNQLTESEYGSVLHATLGHIHNQIETKRAALAVQREPEYDELKLLMKSLHSLEESTRYVASVKNLCRAVDSQPIESVMAILEIKPYVDGWCPKSSTTSSLRAIRAGRLDVVVALRDAGATANDSKIPQRRSPLDLAVESKQLEMVTYVVREFPNQSYQEHTVTALADLLYRAGRRGELDALTAYAHVAPRELSIDLQTEGGANALHGAASRGQVETVRALLALGANAGLKLKDGKSLMAYTEPFSELHDVLTEHQYPKR